MSGDSPMPCVAIRRAIWHVRRSVRRPAALALLAIALCASAEAEAAPGRAPLSRSVSDAALVRALPGFTNHYASVNGVRLHYVTGGKGAPVFLIGGWPETWWEFHKIMPDLAKTHRVLAVDLRGQGSSSKPAGGYDKKTMAGDIAALARLLGYGKVDLVGHDIGSMVAFSFAATHADLLGKIVLIEGAHPTPGFMKLTLLPESGTVGDRIDENHPYLPWFAFHQIRGLPEQLLKGRVGMEQAWFFRYMSKVDGAITPRDRAVYAAAYDATGATRATDGWYQAFAQDIADYQTYPKLTVAVLGLGGVSYGRLKAFLDVAAPGAQVIEVEGSGHFVPEEKPEALLRYLHQFLDGEGVPPT